MSPTAKAQESKVEKAELERQHASYELLQENGFVQHKYNKYRDRCLRERQKLGIGNSKEV